MSQMEKSTQKIIIAVAAVIILGGIGYLIISKIRAGQALAQIGDLSITQTQVDYRDRVNQVFSPANRESLGLQQLIDTFTKAEVLKRNGQPVSTQVLENEAKRIEKETRAPEALTKIKLVFSGDYDNYLQVFVMPIYVDRETVRFFKTGNFPQNSFEDWFKEQKSQISISVTPR